MRKEVGDRVIACMAECVHQKAGFGDEFGLGDS